MFCWHKWGEVEDGYQYCLECNKARTVKCPHKWKIIEEYSLRYAGQSGSHGSKKVLQCTKCGICTSQRL